MAKIVDRIDYPSGKIYIGKDGSDSIDYFGSACDTVIVQDFSAE